MIDDLSTQRYGSLFDLPKGTKYSFLEGDVSTLLSKELAQDIDAVIHLAGITDPVATVTNPDWVYSNNLRITQHVTDICAETNTPLVFVSTTSVYTSESPVVDEECIELNPISPYAKCKLEEETYVRDNLKGRDFVIFRLGTIFGVSPGMRFHTAVNKFCWQAVNEEPIEVWSTAMDQLRPYLAVSDAAQILTRSVLDRVFPGIVINAVTCNSTVRDVLEIIMKCGLEVEVKSVDSSVMNDLSFQTSTKRAAKFGFDFQGDLGRDVQATLNVLGGLRHSLN